MPGTVQDTGSYHPEKTNPTSSHPTAIGSSKLGELLPNPSHPIFRARGAPFTPPLHSTPMLSWV